MILGIRSLGDNLKWTPKTIELGPRYEPKKLRQVLNKGLEKRGVSPIKLTEIPHSAVGDD